MIEQQTSPVYEFAGYRIDAESRLLRRGREVIHVPPKAIDLLLALVESGGRVLTKDELMRHVWPDAFVEETNLTHNISLLRRVLGEKSNGERFIETIPKRGYRFVADVTHPLTGGLEVVARERTLTHVVTEEEIDSTNGQIAVGQAQLMGGPNAFAANRIAIAVSIAAIALVLAGGFYLWQTRNASTATPPFEQAAVKQLTNNGSVGNIALSRDGKLFAYTLIENDGRWSLWLGHTDGSNELGIRPAENVVYRGLSFSADQNSIYYVVSENSDEALYRVPVFGGPPEKQKAQVPTYFALSPDGKQFSVVRRDPSGSGTILAVTDADGSNDRQLASRPAGLGFSHVGPAWSPDGRLIAVSAITDEPSGKKEVYVVNSDDGRVEQLTNLSWQEIRTMSWLEDGSGLIMVAADKGSLGYAAQLWYVSYPAGAARRITSDLNIYGSAISMSADGRSLITVIAQYHTNIWTAPADNLAAATQVTFDSPGRAVGISGVTWMPDGRLLCSALIDKNVSLWLMNADGTERRQLTSTGNTDALPSVPAHGRFIVFESDRSGSTEVWRIGTDGGDLIQLTDGGKVSQPHVSLDGNWIVYSGTHDGKGGLWRISAEGGQPQSLIEGWTVSPRFSPDGRSIAAGVSDGGRLQLAMLSADDGRLLRSFDVPRLANFRGSIRWTPDGKSITYRDWADGMWRQPIEGGEPIKLAGLPNEKLYGYDWSPDGKSIAYSRGKENRDVVLFRRSQ